MFFRKISPLFLSFFLAALLVGSSASPALAQSGTSGSVEGVVKDPTGAVIPGANIAISNPVSGLHRDTVSGAIGDFRFPNLPINAYHMVVSAPGFATLTQDVDVRSTIVVAVQSVLAIATNDNTVDVKADAGDLIETNPTAHTDIDRQLFDKLSAQTL